MVPLAGPRRRAAPSLRLLGAVVLLLGTMAVIGTAVRDTQRSVSAMQDERTSAPFEVDTDRMACLEDRVRETIPTGATVVVDDPVTLSRQRLAEMLTPGYRHSSAPVAGAYVVRIQPPGPCSGYGVVVARPAPP